MPRLAVAVGLTLTLSLLSACSTGPQQPVSSERFTLVEHAQVVGSCFEDHVGEAARYAGYVERWRDTQKNRELLHGSVTTLDRLNDSPDKKYRPPHSIQFGDVGADKLAGDRVVLKGLTEGSRPTEATCTLDVTKRDRPAGRGPLPMTARNALSGAGLVIGLVAGVRLVRHQVRYTIAPLLLGLAFLLQLISLLLP